MKTHLPGRLVHKLLLYLFCMACAAGAMATNVTGNQFGTWTKANSPYVIQGTVTVPAGKKLTIEPGVEVRSLRYDDKFTVEGVLYAVGTAADSIRFNGFSNAGVDPASTHGGLLYINSATTGDSTVLAYISMNKWGDKDYYTGDQAAIELGNGKITVRNSRIANSEAQAIWGYGDLATLPVIKDVVFVNNPTPMHMYTDNVGGISNCTGAVIYLQGGTFSRASTIPKPGPSSYYILDKASGHYFEDAKLTIQAGVEIRSMNFSDKIQLDGNSVLKATGTAADSIRFKGFADASTPGSSHGGILIINTTTGTDSTVMLFISMDKMGDKDYYSGDQTAIEIEGGVFVMRNSRISNSELKSIWGYGDLATDPVIDKVTFATTPVPVSVYTDNAGKIANCTNAAITLQGGTFSKTSTISKPGTGSYYILQKGIGHYFENVKLTIQAGVEIRSMNYADKIKLEGSSVLKAIGTAADSIKFKGYPDAATDPLSTHGGFIDVNTTVGTDSTVMAYISMDKWGDKDYYTGDQTAIELESGNFVIRNSRISNSEARGIWGYGDLPKDPVIANLTFVNTPVPVSVYSDNAGAITNNTNAYITLQGGTFTKTSVISNPGPGSFYILDKGIGHYFESVNLTIQPGVEIHSMNYADKIVMDGTAVLKAIGTEDDSIYFKGYADPTTNVKSTHGGIIIINSTGNADSSVFAYVTIDKMGDKDYYTSDQAALELENGKLFITNSTIRNSELKGIYGYGDASNMRVYKSYLYNNPNAAVFNSGKPWFGKSNIYGNTIFAINNLSAVVKDTVDARNNWWGDASGPKQTTLNPNGLGNPVSKKVLFNPWLIRPYQVNDVGVAAIVTPVSGCSLTGTEQVKVRLTNYGSKSQTGFNVSYRINNGPVVTENVNTLKLYSDSSAVFTFATKADFGTPGTTYTLKVFTGLIGDTVKVNDTTTAAVINRKPNLGKDTAVKTCAGSAVNISNLYSTAGYTSATYSTARPDSVTAGSYTLIVVNSFGCIDTAVITVANNPKPNLGKDTAIKICLGSSATIKKLYDTTGLSIAWGTPRPDSVVKGTYTIIATNAFGCKDTAVVTVNTNPKPNLGKDTTVKICTGAFVSIRNLYDTTGYKTIKFNTPTPDSVGKGTYRLIVTNTQGCVDTANIKIDTLPSPAKPGITKTGTTTFCVGDSLVLSTTTTGTLQWYRNNTAIKKATTNKYVVKLGGSYKLQASNAGSCAVFSDSVVTTVPQIAKPTITLLNDSLISSSATGNQWFENNFMLTGITAQKYSPDNIDAYTVQVTVSGCKSPMSDPFYYTANTLIMKHKLGSATDASGLKAGGNMQVSMYPNPAISEANITVTGTGSKLAITVTDMSGRKIAATEGFYNKRVTLPVQNLAAGMYMVIITDGKQTKTIKLLKQ